MAFHFTGESKFVERALRHPGEDINHGVDAVLLVTLHEVNNFSAVGEELSLEKTVHQEHLTWRVEKLLLKQ